LILPERKCDRYLVKVTTIFILNVYLLYFKRVDFLFVKWVFKHCWYILRILHRFVRLSNLVIVTFWLKIHRDNITFTEHKILFCFIWSTLGFVTVIVFVLVFQTWLPWFWNNCLVICHEEKRNFGNAFLWIENKQTFWCKDNSL
jgi:hypothetical protein